MNGIKEIEIPITVICEEANSEGAMWNVKDVIDEREGYSIGDIGIYEFSGFDDEFPEKIMNAVLVTLKEIDEFEQKDIFYSVEINIIYGGNQLGFASRHFYGHQMVNKFQIIEVPSDAYTELEQMGTKFKFWYRDEKHGYCLFKEGHPNTGEDWAERVVSELCEFIELPHAIYKLAVWQGRNGVITPNFLTMNERYAAGNEVLFRLDSTYPKCILVYYIFWLQKSWRGISRNYIDVDFYCSNYQSFL